MKRGRIILLILMNYDPGQMLDGVRCVESARHFRIGKVSAKCSLLAIRPWPKLLPH